MTLERRTRTEGAVVTALLACVIVFARDNATAGEASTTPLLLVSETACAVSVDGRRVADIVPDEPLRLDLSPGEYLLSAVSGDGRRWSKVLALGAEKVVLRIDFAGAGVRVISPSSPGASHSTAPVAPPSVPTIAVGSLGDAGRAPSWVSISPGDFEMGCSVDDRDCTQAELPRRSVRVSPGFALMDRQVTVAQFRDWATRTSRELPKQPRWSEDDVPVVNVTWGEAVAFCAFYAGRLPTEIEWEFAARAGSSAARYGPLDDIAWFAGNSGKRAHPVATRKPNAFGLFDMLGNVWEWTADVFRPTLSPEDRAETPSTGLRALRGGSWRNGARQIRASNRGRLPPDDREDDDGFRCARDLP